MTPSHEEIEAAFDYIVRADEVGFTDKPLSFFFRIRRKFFQMGGVDETVVFTSLKLDFVKIFPCSSESVLHVVDFGKIRGVALIDLKSYYGEKN